MQPVVQEFQERVAEIESYLDFVKAVDDGTTCLLRESDGFPVYSPTGQDDLLRTFKASAVLMLYNLMESSVTNAVEAIFDELEQKAISFDVCREEIRLVVLGNLKRHNSKSLLPDLNAIALDIVTKTFRKSEVASGNIDAREIREMAKVYGFTSPTSRGDRLLTVKTHRNDLAHGSKSFSEVGRIFSVPDVIQIKREVVDYLAEMLVSVSDYLTNSKYLAAS